MVSVLPASLCCLGVRTSGRMAAAGSIAVRFSQTSSLCALVTHHAPRGVEGRVAFSVLGAGLRALTGLPCVLWLQPVHPPTGAPTASTRAAVTTGPSAAPTTGSVSALPAGQDSTAPRVSDQPPEARQGPAPREHAAAGAGHTRDAAPRRPARAGVFQLPRDL